MTRIYYYTFNCLIKRASTSITEAPQGCERIHIHGTDQLRGVPHRCSSSELVGVVRQSLCH